jgi:hypothetical protein
MSSDATFRPRIGLTLDAEPPGGYSKLPWYAIREMIAFRFTDSFAFKQLL